MLKKQQETTIDETLGRKLRACRKETGLTMQAVADATGLSVGFISQLERDLTVPSLSSLRAIAQVLRRPISFFLAQPESPLDTTRSDERPVYGFGEGALAYERLSARFPGSTLCSLLIHEPPGHRSEPVSHEGEELFFVLHGALTVEIEGVQTQLRQGDSIHFESHRVHAVWNQRKTPAMLLWCGTMDVFNEDVVHPTHGRTFKQ